MSSNTNDFNQQIITEFRANGGKVGGPFADGHLLLLTTTGARSGKPRTIPLGYPPDEDRIIIIASYNGAPNHPDWYHNLVAHPEAIVEVGAERFPVRAMVIEGEEREQLWNRLAEQMPFLAEHQQKTTRLIPLVALELIG
ncbi:MAG: nitroreductase family deazaflavin-dependent oxidoreductase [Thermomicrobiales bacterium]